MEKLAGVLWTQTIESQIQDAPVTAGGKALQRREKKDVQFLARMGTLKNLCHLAETAFLGERERRIAGAIR